MVSFCSQVLFYCSNERIFIIDELITLRKTVRMHYQAPVALSAYTGHGYEG